MVENRQNLCDFPAVLERTNNPVTCNDRMKKSFKDPGNCIRCPKARGTAVALAARPDFTVRPSRPDQMRVG